MRNIDFDLGFKVDREKLSEEMTNLVSQDTDLYCLLETSFGYTGVNIKIPVYQDCINSKMYVTKVVIDKNLIQKNTNILYGDYIDECKIVPKKKQKFHTFLVFHSGKVIFSGMTKELMEDTYYFFIGLISKMKNNIEEKLDIM